VILLPRRGCILGGPKGFTGGTGSRRREAAGRRNYPEAVPKERRGGNGNLMESTANHFGPQADGQQDNDDKFRGFTTSCRTDTYDRNSRECPYPAFGWANVRRNNTSRISESAGCRTRRSALDVRRWRFRFDQATSSSRFSGLKSLEARIIRECSESGLPAWP